MAMVKAAGGVPVQVPLREELGWRWNIADVEKAITPKTRVLYLNSPNNPSGGVLTRQDIERLAQIARDRNLWVVSDEAYEDVVYKGEHVSIASLPGMYEPHHSGLHPEQELRDHRRARRLLRDQGSGAARPRAQDHPLHDQQRLVDRAVRRARGDGRLAAVHRRLQERAADSPRHVLQGPRGSGAGRVLGHAAGRRVLRVREDQSATGRRAPASPATRCRGRWRNT